MKELYDLPYTIEDEDSILHLHVYYYAEVDTVEGVTRIDVKSVELPEGDEYAMTREEQKRLIDYLFDNHEAH